jgi:3D (Asp-Asp-Asp) domain-containing protein
MIIMLISLWLGAARADEGIGLFRNTHYYVALESIYASDERTDDILTMSDEVLARVSARFRKAMDIEGTGRLIDGRVLNFAGRKDGRTRYHLTRHPFGRGAGNCPLVPFHTVAVDPERVPLGSIVKIDETEGMKLPDGTVHDGIWRAEDTGGAIKKDRIDLFVGDGDQGAVLRAHGIANLMPLTLRLVAPAEKENCSHRPAE